jgi:hypothetical protein
VPENEQVVIIDAREPNRGKALASAFESEVCSVSHWFCAPGPGEIPAFSAPPPKTCLLRLWHISDRHHAWPEVQVTGITVFYSGGGGTFPNSERAERVWPDLKDKADVRNIFASGGAKLLLDYARAVSRGEAFQRPWFLEPPVALECLSALTILCQGYLTLHSERPEVVEALARMGWWQLPKELRQELTKNSGAQAGGCETVGWWLDALGPFGRHLAEAAEKEWTRGGPGEFKDQDGLTALIALIESERRIDVPAVVAHAYDQLSLHPGLRIGSGTERT